ncbi:MAG: peptidase C25, partial [Candidatus Thermoplasmatota archaeon]|nr:peptidase C25 [Candidatus Thermoplasmatota archaeon]
DSIQVDVTYNEPAEPLLTADDSYDLLIVTPEAFTDALQPLVQHKEDNGLATKMVTLTEIYRGHYFGFGGRDEPERVKYFIKNALEEWGIRYVMLVGGRRGGLLREKWWCPVRYSHLDDGSDERQYLSDLYFADVYQQDGGNEIAFASWDTNDNGVFAEWQGDGRDRLDMYPDVAVGRLACRNRYEVTKMVEKIIAYETGAAGSSWAKRFVGIAGDTYPASGNRSYYEGELATEAACSYLDGYTSDFRWTSTGTLESADDIVAAISQGAGFVHFSGHGTPMDWATHKPRHRGWIHFDVSQFERLSNKDMYPVAVVGGCHNSQFNVSVLNLLKIRRLQETVDGHTYAPECWGWWLARTFDGGAVATVANTGYGYGQPGEDCLEQRGRYMELMFFKSYAEGTDRLGMTHAQGQTYYIHAFPPMDDRVDCKIVQEWVLLGDPSLKIGGYP